jgi:hypothetical protein|nr:MAG TPA: hypothetical protein [Caudoviricetes sp.]
MSKTFSFDLDVNKGSHSDMIVYGRVGDKGSVSITAHLKLDGTPWSPPSGNKLAYFECVTNNDEAVRVPATLSGSDVSVSLPTDVYSMFGIVSNAYFRIEVGDAKAPTYIESTASFSVYVLGSVDMVYNEPGKLDQFRSLHSQLVSALADANAVVKEADALKNGQLAKPLTISSGGTGATDVVKARANLGINAIPSSIPVPISEGGTGATDAAKARSNLGISTSSFSGSYNDLKDKPVIPSSIPVPVPEGGTGNKLGIVNVAKRLASSRSILVNLASSNASPFDGTANATPGVLGVLPITNGGTGGNTVRAASYNLDLYGGLCFYATDTDNCFPIGSGYGNYSSVYMWGHLVIVSVSFCYNWSGRIYDSKKIMSLLPKPIGVTLGVAQVDKASGAAVELRLDKDGNLFVLPGADIYYPSAAVDSQLHGQICYITNDSYASHAVSADSGIVNVPVPPL